MTSEQTIQVLETAKTLLKSNYLSTEVVVADSIQVISNQLFEQGVRIVTTSFECVLIISDINKWRSLEGL